MKTIEERAREYADNQEQAELELHGLGHVYGYSQIYNSEKVAYERGANEQKAIDIENACKACENELRRLKALLNERGVPANLISVGKSLSNIRKEMEE